MRIVRNLVAALAPAAALLAAPASAATPALPIPAQLCSTAAKATQALGASQTKIDCPKKSHDATHATSRGDKHAGGKAAGGASKTPPV